MLYLDKQQLCVFPQRKSVHFQWQSSYNLIIQCPLFFLKAFLQLYPLKINDVEFISGQINSLIYTLPATVLFILLFLNKWYSYRKKNILVPLCNWISREFKSYKNRFLLQNIFSSVCNCHNLQP